jgi:hypothetical protein
VVYDLGARGERLASRRAGKNGKLTPEWLTVFGRPTSHPSLWDGVAADAELMMREVG